MGDDHLNYWPPPDETDEINPFEARPMCLFFARSWFSRMWVIQEVAAAEKILLFCGPHSIPWGDLVLASFYVYRHRWNTRLVRKGLPETLGSDASIHAFALQDSSIGRAI
jgi:hypothetical protein